MFFLTLTKKFCCLNLRVASQCYSSVIVLFYKPDMQHLLRNVSNQHIFLNVDIHCILETMICNIRNVEILHFPVSGNANGQYFFLAIELDYYHYASVLRSFSKIDFLILILISRLVTSLRLTKGHQKY